MKFQRDLMGELYTCICSEEFRFLVDPKEQ